MKQVSNKEESRPLVADGSKTNTLEDINYNTSGSRTVQEPDWIKVTSILNRTSKDCLYIELRNGAGVRQTNRGTFKVCITDIADVVYDHDLKTGRRVI